MNPTETSRPSHRRLAALFLVALIIQGCSPDVEVEAGAEEETESAEAESPQTRVTLSESAHRTADIQVESVREEADARVVGGMEVPGNVEFAPDRVALVSSRTAGRIERLAAVPGDRVDAGQPVAFLLSPSFLTAQNDLAQAARRVAALQGTPDEAGARALAQAARRRLQLLGADGAIIESIEGGAAPIDLLPILTPFAGSIVESFQLMGAAVEAGTPIYKIADLSVVNVVADVPEAGIGRLGPGQAATVRVSAYPDLRLQGRVARIQDELDPGSRTVKAVIQVPNPDRRLRPGMFAAVSLAGLAGTEAPASAILTIPASAVVTDGAERFVFVETGERTYERRDVEVRPAGDGRVAVDLGLVPGDRVVVRGAFTLKSELGKSEFAEEEEGP